MTTTVATTPGGINADNTSLIDPRSTWGVAFTPPPTLIVTRDGLCLCHGWLIGESGSDSIPTRGQGWLRGYPAKPPTGPFHGILRLSRRLTGWPGKDDPEEKADGAAA